MPASDEAPSRPSLLGTRPSLLGTRTALASALIAALPVVVIVAFTAVLLRVPLGGSAMLSYDLYVYFFPAKHLIREAFARGEWPLWNPSTFFGAPFLANIQMAVLYPPDVVFLLANFPRAVAASQWFHLTVAGIGFLLLARRGWGLGPWGASLGAVGFAGSGFLAAHMGHLNQVHASTWLPWLALAIHRGAAAGGEAWRAARAPGSGAFAILAGPAGRRLVRWIAAGGVATALLVTAGHTQEAYYALLAIGGEAALFAVVPPRRAPVRFAHACVLALAVATGGALAAAQLVPTLELVGHGYRVGGMSRDEAGSYAVDRSHLLESLLPTYWALPAQETTGYVGAVFLPLAVVGLAASPGRRQVLALAATAALSLVLALGTYTSLFDVLLRHLPLFASFRAPGRWLLVWTYAVAGLAAHGLDAIDARRPAAARARLVPVVIGALALATLATGVAATRTWAVGGVQWFPPGRVALLWLWCGAAGTTGALALVQFGGPVHVATRATIVAVAMGELALAGHRMEYAWPGDPILYGSPPPVVAWAHARLDPRSPDASPPRLVSLTVEQHLDAQRLARSASGATGDTLRYRAIQDALKPGLGSVYDLPTIDGYDGGLLPTRAYARFKALLLPPLRVTPPPHLTLAADARGRADARLYAALGIGAVISDGRDGSPGDHWRTVDEAPGAAWWHENTIKLASRALAIDRVIVEPDDDRAIRLLRSLDLATVATVAAPVPGIAAVDPAGLVTPASDTRPIARVTAYGAHEVVIEASATRPALVVLTDTDYPGWRASVDGSPVPIIRADTLFRAVAIPPGEHVVRFEYAPWSVLAGAAISVIAAVGMTGAVAWTALGTRRTA